MPAENYWLGIREGVVAECYKKNKADNVSICDECLKLCAKVIAELTENDIIEVCQEEKAVCSFCDKSNTEVEDLVRGPGGLVYICKNCVKEAVEEILVYLKS